MGLAHCALQVTGSLLLEKMDKMAYNLRLSTIEGGVFAIFKTNTLVTIIKPQLTRRKTDA